MRPAHSHRAKTTMKKLENENPILIGDMWFIVFSHGRANGPEAEALGECAKHQEKRT